MTCLDGHDNGDGCGDFDDGDKLAKDPFINKNLATAPSLRTEQINSKWLSGRDCAGFDGDDDGGDGSVDGDNLLTWYVHLDIDKSYFIR